MRIEAVMLSASGPASSSREAVESRMSKIARRAHEIYEARGGTDGRALEDWLQAEREVDAETDAGPGAGKPDLASS